MNKDLLNILQSEEPPLNEQQILDYLEGKLKDGKQQELEEQLANDDLFRDAIEGLQTVTDRSRLTAMTQELNAAMRARLDNRSSKRKAKRKWKDLDWINISIITVLLLLIISYLVVKFAGK